MTTHFVKWNNEITRTYRVLYLKSMATYFVVPWPRKKPVFGFELATVHN